MSGIYLLRDKEMRPNKRDCEGCKLGRLLALHIAPVCGLGKREKLGLEQESAYCGQQSEMRKDLVKSQGP